MKFWLQVFFEQLRGVLEGNTNDEEYFVVLRVPIIGFCLFSVFQFTLEKSLVGITNDFIIEE
jgi:hypothetical protein